MSKTTMNTFPKIKLTYVDDEDGAEATRLALHVGGMPLVDERVSAEQFAEMKASLPFGQLPMLEVDGNAVAGMLRYAGHLAKLYPANNPIMALKIDCSCRFMSKLVKRKELATVIFPPYLQRIEVRLVKLEQQLPSDQLYVLHFSLYSGHLDNIPATIIDGYKLWTSAHDRVAVHPMQDRAKTLAHLFPKPGRAEAIRLAVHIGGIIFEDERINFNELPSRKSSLLFEKLLVLEVNGETISQTYPLLRYDSTLAGLYPENDPLAALRIDEVFGVIDDLISACEEVGEEELAKVTIPRYLSALDKRVSQWNAGFAIGDRLTVADLLIFYCNGPAQIAASSATGFGDRACV
ncbi:TPA: LOW QUALITY PROTEIN: hypothetical protein N0F65_010981, partial [Lagenidium giganteum]